ncbi:MAG TPA: flippase [Ignavibacteriaceae bacterium]|nr:flippase [Ignavibacteriaceae bacterium]
MQFQYILEKSDGPGIMEFNKNLKNTISLFSFELLSRLLGFLAVTYLARILGKSSFGVINIGLAVLSYTMIFGSGGLNLLGTRKIISKNEDSTITSDIISARIFLSVIIYIITAVPVYFLIHSREIAAVILAYNLFLFPSAFLLEWFFQGYQRMDIISFGRIAGMTAYLLLILIIVKNPGDTVMTGIAWTGGGIINAVLLIYYFKKFNYKLKINLRNLKSFYLIKESFFLGTAAAITSFVQMFPIIYLGIIAGTNEAGIYSAASKTVILMLVFDRVFSALFFPKIIKYFNESPDTLNNILNRSLKIISFFSLSFSVLTVIVSGFMINFIFGSGFAGAVLPFRILTAFFAMTLVNSIFTYTLIGINREKIYTASIFLGMIIFLISTFLLTDFLGTPGPAAAMILFELSSMLFMYYKISKIFSFKLYSKFLFPSAAAVIISLLLLALKTSLLIQIILTLIVAVPVIALLTGFTFEEIRFIKRIFT